jgi:hypothetical protein
MPRPLHYCTTALLSVFLCTCGVSDHRDAAMPPAGTAPPGLTVTGSATGILLSNSDTVPIYFAVYNVALLPRIEWAPCTEPRRCDVVAPGTQRMVAMRGMPSDSAVVFWWRLIPSSHGLLRPDSVRSVAVPMR